MDTQIIACPLELEDKSPMGITVIIAGGRETKLTFKKYCPFSIQVTLSGDCMFVEVSKVNEEHNHETSKQLYMQLPKQRRLPEDVQNEVASHLHLQANKKLVQQKVMWETNKIVTLRDLTNLARKGTSSKTFHETTEMVRNMHDCDIELQVNSNKELFGIFIQDPIMKAAFHFYSEIIFVDSTYKLVDTNFPLLVLMTENGNGESEVVAVGLFVIEDRETMKWFFETFIKKNKCDNIRVAVTDKDFIERSVISDLLPMCSSRLRRFISYLTYLH
ncbi:hypothetical protein JTE90_029145 [Oedothorax gibbosus]|uniref:ZSWIM1/3 RNaseH-like domain-containing protein n=1 Tax=Oedothorax gibbosus TaxID=931172 RepID=A0AAV6UAD5_9ARAC|nr:hypothetical protein JTE90_029145 [Oedothorax gibbosus]